MSAVQGRDAVLLFTTALCLLAGSLPAQDALTAHTVGLAEGNEPARATIADVAWLEGSWGADAFGGWCEEYWSAPRDAAMIGMYRLHKEGKPVFSELMTLSEEAGSVLMRVRHFNPDLVAWEEKDSSLGFQLVAVEDGTLRFHGLTFQRLGKDEIAVFLAMRQRDGSYREERFTYRRLETGRGEPVEQEQPVERDGG